MCAILSQFLFLFPVTPTQVSLVLLSVSLTLCVIFSTLPAFTLVVCFDAKINFDDNAEFRQKAVFAMDDMSESDPTEMHAAKWDLKYIGLDGNIACFGKKLRGNLCGSLTSFCFSFHNNCIDPTVNSQTRSSMIRV